MKGRTKRPHSAGSGSTKRPSTADGVTGLGGSGALWQVDIGETSVWTIVGTGESLLDVIG
jgi:recombining binding protein (suppressor of hairless)